MLNEYVTTHNFKNNLAKLMEKKKINQVELSKHSGVHQTMISRYLREDPKGKLPALETIIALANALNCSMNELLGLEIDKPEELIADLPPEIPKDILEIVENYKELDPEKQKDFFNFVMTYFKAYLDKK